MDRFVGMFPDVVVRLSDGPDPVVIAILSSYDRQFAGGDPSWRRRWRQLELTHASRRDREAFRDEALVRGVLHLAAMAAIEVLDADDWSRVVAAAGKVPDPTVWHALLAAQPIGAAWPGSTGFASEADLQVALCSWHLDRTETSAAVVAALRAEAAATGPTKDRARVLRARALAAEQRRAEALLVLEDLADDPSTSERVEAAAVAGALAGELDDLLSAKALLERAVAAPFDWPGRGRAMADLAIVCLRSDDAVRGVRLLEEAAAECRRCEDLPGLVRTLTNHAAWLRLRGRTEQAEAVAEEARAVAVANAFAVGR